MYVGQISELPEGTSRPFLSPSGERYLLTHVSDGEIVAFSATCPHLGCKVHWEERNSRFYCPCHGGAFNQQGEPTEGPPKDENTPLTRLDLAVEGGAIYAVVPLT
jgi:Rieske Fe-S protein